MLPRVKGETHTHTDGSAAVLDIREELYELAGTPQAERKSAEEFRAFFANVHGDLLAKFRLVGGLLQSSEALKLMGYAYGRHYARKGMTYMEPQFAPQYHVFGGLAPRVATHHLIEGYRKAESEFGISLFPILDIGREVDAETGESLARIALTYDGEIGLGLACVEPGNPPEKHLRAFSLTFRTKVPRTGHFGEWVEPDPPESYRARLLENVRTAVRVLRCDDIGQAIPLCDDPELVREVADKGIRVSYCPLSNKQGGLIRDVRELRIGEMLDAGVLATINSDDDLFFPTLEEVAAECEAAYDFTPAQAKALENNVFVGRLAD